MISSDFVLSGANAEYTCVDERIVGRKPKSLSFKEAAAEPLTVLTAWEAIVEEMHVPVPKGTVPVSTVKPNSTVTSFSFR